MNEIWEKCIHIGYMYILSLPLNRDEWIGASLVAIISKEKKCKRLTQKRRSRRKVKKAGLARERKRYFFNEWVKSYQFLPTFREEVCFYYLVYLRLYSFCNWDFGTIVWIAVSSGTDEYRPFAIVENVSRRSQFRDKSSIYSANLAAQTCIMCFSSRALFLPRSQEAHW